MKNITKKIFFSIVLISLVFLPSVAMAIPGDEWETTTIKIETPPKEGTDSSGMLGRLQKVGDSSGYDLNVTPPEIIGFIIGAFINFLGLVFIVLIVASGYTWMTAGGNEEKVKKATTTLKEAVIGLVLTVSAWTLWNFILKSLIIRG